MYISNLGSLESFPFSQRCLNGGAIIFFLFFKNIVPFFVNSSKNNSDNR